MRGQEDLTAEKAISVASLLEDLGAQVDLAQTRVVRVPLRLDVTWQGRRATAHYGNEAEMILNDVRNASWRFSGWYTLTT